MRERAECWFKSLRSWRTCVALSRPTAALPPSPTKDTGPTVHCTAEVWHVSNPWCTSQFLDSATFPRLRKQCPAPDRSPVEPHQHASRAVPRLHPTSASQPAARPLPPCCSVLVRGPRPLFPRPARTPRSCRRVCAVRQSATRAAAAWSRPVSARRRCGRHTGAGSNVTPPCVLTAWCSAPSTLGTRPRRWRGGDVFRQVPPASTHTAARRRCLHAWLLPWHGALAHLTPVRRS